MRILAVGAHPDDIEVLVSGTLAKYRKKDAKVLGLILSDGTEERLIEAEQAAKILDISIRYLGWPTDIAFSQENVTVFDSIIQGFQPNIIFTHHPGDSHQGHQAAAKLIFAACRRYPVTILLYERALPGGLTPHIFRPQWFENITDTIKQKIEAVKCHKSQEPLKWVESLKGRALYWGQVVSCKYAEVFEVVKICK